MQYRWRLLTNASVSQLIALIRSRNHFLGSSLKHDPSWSPGNCFVPVPKKQQQKRISTTTTSWWKYKTERWMYYKTQRKRGKKLRSPGCSCAQLLRAARWSAEGAEAAEIVVRRSSRSGPGSGYYGSWRSTGGSPLGSSWAAVSSERADSVLCGERQSERERERARRRERERERAISARQRCSPQPGRNGIHNLLEGEEWNRERRKERASKRQHERWGLKWQEKTQAEECARGEKARKMKCFNVCVAVSANRTRVGHEDDRSWTILKMQ